MLVRRRPLGLRPSSVRDLSLVTSVAPPAAALAVLWPATWPDANVPAKAGRANRRAIAASAVAAPQPRRHHHRPRWSTLRHRSLRQYLRIDQCHSQYAAVPARSSCLAVPEGLDALPIPPAASPTVRHLWAPSAAPTVPPLGPIDGKGCGVSVGGAGGARCARRPAVPASFSSRAAEWDGGG